MRRLDAATGRRLVTNVNRALFASADAIKSEAQNSITRGSVSGKDHVPSAPGEAPNNDTGVLKNNIEATQPRPLVAEVSSNAPYAAPLEFGSSRMEARPYLAPARDKLRGEVERNVAKAVEHTLGSVR